MKSKGLTPIEVLTVVAILGIIAAVIIPNISLFVSQGVVEEPPSITDAPYQVIITTTNSRTVIRYCPAGGYELRDCCVLFTKCYTRTDDKPTTYFYSDNIQMFCDIMRIEVIDREKGSNN